MSQINQICLGFYLKLFTISALPTQNSSNSSCTKCKFMNNSIDEKLPLVEKIKRSARQIGAKCGRATGTGWSCLCSSTLLCSALPLLSCLCSAASPARVAALLQCTMWLSFSKSSSRENLFLCSHFIEIWLFQTEYLEIFFLLGLTFDIYVPSLLFKI